MVKFYRIFLGKCQLKRILDSFTHIASRSKRTMQMAQLQASLPVAHVVQCHAINLLERSSDLSIN
jgi:hypothetical protein